MSQEDRIEIYTIPPNFAEEGTMFSGRIKTRNAVETAVLLSVLLPLLLSLEVSAKTKVYIGMIVLVPVVVLAVLGIQGESLFAFVASFFRFVLRRRNLTPPDDKYRLEQNRRKKKAGKEAADSDGRERHQTGAEKGVEAGTEKNPKTVETGTKKPVFPEKRKKNRTGKNKEGTAKDRKNRSLRFAIHKSFRRDSH